MSYLDADGGAVYRIYDRDAALIYIGSTGDLRARMRQHLTAAPATPTAEAISARYHDHTVEFFPTLGQARAAEFDAIATEKPELNINGRTGRVESDIEAAVRGAAAERGVSMCELAYREDMDVRNLARLLSTREVTTGVLLGICNTLDIQLSALFERAEQVAA